MILMSRFFSEDETDSATTEVRLPKKIFFYELVLFSESEHVISFNPKLLGYKNRDTFKSVQSASDWLFSVFDNIRCTI